MENAMAPGAELSILAPQASLGQGDASDSNVSEGIGRLRRGDGDAKPRWS